MMQGFSSIFRKYLIVVFVVWAGAVQAKGAPITSDQPVLNQGQKWQLGYYQGGEYYDYYQYLKVTVEGLMERGWIESDTVPADLASTGELWLWLHEHAQSDYLEFTPDGFYSANWDREYRKNIREQILDRLNQAADIDLMMALGTWAGIDLVTARHLTPTMVMSVNDPKSVGLLDARKAAELNHIYIFDNPLQYERQVNLFHDLIRFKTLGVAYENSFEGRSYASIDMVERLAAERGFELITCHTLSDVTDQNKAEESVIRCFKELAEKVDAIYVTVQGGINSATIPELVKITNQYDIPTFSQSGHREVKMGYLMSLSGIDNLRREGLKLSTDMAAIFHGHLPGLLASKSVSSNRIILNLETAEQIGLYLDADLLAAADQIYWQIENP